VGSGKGEERERPLPGRARLAGFAREAGPGTFPGGLSKSTSDTVRLFRERALARIGQADEANLICCYSHEMAFADAAIRNHFPGAMEHRAVIAFFAALAAGAAGFRYVSADEALSDLALYGFALLFVYLAFRALTLAGVGGSATTRPARLLVANTPATAKANRHAAPAPPFTLTPPPDQSRGSRPACTKRPKEKPQDTARAPCPETGAFDFDGLAALRGQARITGRWLATEASEAAVERVRSACLAGLGDAANDRRQRDKWFDAIVALRHVDTARFPKAELARAHVAEQVGLGYEAVRKIATGRYGPLNDALALIDPKAL